MNKKGKRHQVGKSTTRADRKRKRSGKSLWSREVKLEYQHLVEKTKFLWN